MKKDEMCSSCKFFKKLPPNKIKGVLQFLARTNIDDETAEAWVEESGGCHKRPPVTIKDSVYAYFPLIKEFEWCGEYKSREEDKMFHVEHSG